MSILRRLTGSSVARVARLETRALFSTAASSTATTTTAFPKVGDFMSELSARRQPSPTRTLIPLMKIPGMISLGTGLPNARCFPFSSFKFTLTDGVEIALTPTELSESLQYSDTPGIPSFLAELMRLQQAEHKIPYPIDEVAIAVTTGSQDGLTKAFEMLLNPSDSLLVENPTYSGALAFLKPFGVKLIGVNVDDQGLIPSALEKRLRETANSPNRPKVLYTIPTGQNPSGCSTSEQRKREIYKLACQYNLIILEDDPYYNLYYGSSPAPAEGKDESSFAPAKTTSYLSMDTERRVLRFDSFSKVLSSGLRVGFVTGPKTFIDRLNLTSQATNIHPSGLSQVLITKLLRHWGPDGWASHVKQTKLFYARRRDFFLQAARKHLDGLVSYTVPDAGMFVWFRVQGLGTDAKDLIEKKAVAAKVLMLPGEAFLVEQSKANELFVRASFSVATDEQIENALARFGTLLKEQFAKAAGVV